MKGLLQRLARRFAPSLPSAAEEPGDTLATASAGTMESAIGHHQAGRLNEAEAIYRRLLAADPKHADALHLWGVLAQQTGDSARAIELITRSITINPGNSAAHSNLGVAHQSLHHLDEAEACFRSALALRPDWDSAHNNLGIVLQARGDHAGAEACFRRALLLKPDSAEALNNLGNALKERKALDEAEACYRRSVAMQPTLAEGYFNLGSVLQQGGKLTDAEAAYRQSLALRPTYAEALCELGSVLRAQGNLEDAERYLLEAVDARPDFAEAHCNLGDVLQATGRLDEAETCCRKALALRPAYADALANLAAIGKRLGRLDEAERHCRQALALEPNHPRAWNALGTIANERGHLDEAEAHYRHALELAPASAPTRYNLGVLRLLRGDYREGLALYEARFESFGAGDLAGSARVHRELAHVPRWRGDPLVGRRLLVWTEQGLGDSLMAMRFLARLRDLGSGAVIVYCESALERVLAAMPGVDQVITEPAPVPFGAFDVHCPVMSLPLMFEAQLDSIPNEVPYLDVPESLRRRWNERLSKIAGLKVGLAWAGNPSLRADAKRSIPLYRFAPLVGIHGVKFISLQKGVEAGQLRESGWAIPDWMDECVDLMDTAALVANLDLVIAVDTAVAHLAGALGRPVWLLNRFESEWRWGIGRVDSPWYPTMRILRQEAPGDWDDVIAQAGADLELLYRGSRLPLGE